MDENKKEDINRLNTNAQFSLEQISKESLEFIPNNSSISNEPPSLIKPFNITPIFSAFIKTLDTYDMKEFLIPETQAGMTDKIFQHVRYKLSKSSVSDKYNDYLHIIAEYLGKHTNKSFRGEFKSISEIEFSPAISAYCSYVKSCSNSNSFSGYLFAILMSFYLFLGKAKEEADERCSVLFNRKDDPPVFKIINKNVGYHFLSEGINNNYYTKIINHLENIHTHHKQDGSGVQNTDIPNKNTPFTLYSDIVFLLATMTRLADLYFLVDDNEMNIIKPPNPCLQPHEFTFSIFYAILCFIYENYLSNKENNIFSNNEDFNIDFEKLNKNDNIRNDNSKDKEFNEPNNLMIPIITFLLQLLAYNLKAIPYSHQSYEDVGLSYRINEKDENLSKNETPQNKKKNITLFLTCFLSVLENYYEEASKCNEKNLYFITIKESIEYSYRILIKCLFLNDLYGKVIERLEKCKNETICEWIVNSIETCHPDLFLYEIDYNPNIDNYLLHDSIYYTTEESKIMHKECFKSLYENLKKMKINISKKFTDKNGKRNRYINRNKYIELFNTMQTWFLKIQSQYYDSTPETMLKLDMLGIFQPLGENMSTYLFNYPIYPNTGIHTFIYRFNEEESLNVIYGLSEYTVPSNFIGFNKSSVGYHGSGSFYCKGRKVEGFMKLGKKYDPRIDNKNEGQEIRYNPQEIFLTYDSCRGYLEIAFITITDANYTDLYVPIAYFKIDNTIIYYPSVSCNTGASFSLTHYNNVIKEIYDDYRKYNVNNCRKSGHFCEGDCLYEEHELGMKYIKEMCDFIKPIIDGDLEMERESEENEKDDDDDDDDEDSKKQMKLGLLRVVDNFISQLCLYSYFPNLNNYNLIDDTLLPLANQFDSIISTDLSEIDDAYDYQLTGHYLFLFQKIYPLPKERTKFFNIDLVQDEIYVKGTKEKREINGRADGNTWEFTLSTELSRTERLIFTCHSVIMPSGNRFIGKFENPRNNSHGYFIGIKIGKLTNLKIDEIELLKVKTSTKLHYLIGKATASYPCINRITNLADYEYILQEKCPNIFQNKFFLFKVLEKEEDKAIKDMCEYIDNNYNINSSSSVLPFSENISNFIECGSKENIFFKYFKIPKENENEWKLYRVAIGLFFYHLTDKREINDENVKDFIMKNQLYVANERNGIFLGNENDLLYFKHQLINRFNEMKKKNEKDDEIIEKVKTMIENDEKSIFLKASEKAIVINEKVKDIAEEATWNDLIQKVNDLLYFYPLIDNLPKDFNRRKIIEEIITFLFEIRFGYDSDSQEDKKIENVNDINQENKSQEDCFFKFLRSKISGILHCCYTYTRFEKLLIGNKNIRYSGNYYMYLNWYKRFQNYTCYIPVNHSDDPMYLHYLIQDVSEEDFFLSLIDENKNSNSKTWRYCQFNPNKIQNYIEKEMLFKLAPEFEKVINQSFCKIFKQLVDYLPNDNNNNKLTSVDISKYLAIIDSMHKKYTQNELDCIKQHFVKELIKKIPCIFKIEDVILKKSYSYFLYTLSKSICDNDVEGKESVGISIIENLLKELDKSINSNFNSIVDVRDTFNEIITLDIYQDIYSPSISILTELSSNKIVDVKNYLPILIHAFLTCNHADLPFIIVKFLNNWLTEIENPGDLIIEIPEEILKNYIDKGEKENIPPCNQIIQLFLTMSGFMYPVYFGNFIKYFLKTDTYLLACRVASLLRNLQKKSEKWSNIINEEIIQVLKQVEIINKENINVENFGRSKKLLKDIFNQKDTLFYKFIGSLHVIGGNYECLRIGSRVEVLHNIINRSSYFGTVISKSKEYYSRKTGTLNIDPNLDPINGAPKESTTYIAKECYDIKCDDGKIKKDVISDNITPIPLVNSQPYRISVEIIEILLNMLDTIYTLYYNYKLVKANTDFFFIVTFMIFGTNSLSSLLHNKNTIQTIINKKPYMLTKVLYLANAVLNGTSSVLDYPTLHEAFKELFHFWNEKEMSFISRNIEPEINQSFRQLNSRQIDALKTIIDLDIPVEKAIKFIINEDRPNSEEIIKKIFPEEIKEEKTFSYIGVVSGDGKIDGNNVVANDEKYLTFTVGIPSATCVNGKKYYYEVFINEIGDGVYFGWADPAYSKTNVDEKYALGADRHSYSWGGKDSNTFISRNSKSKSTGNILTNGYTIGCLLDLESIPNSISYTINGVSFTAFQGSTHYSYLYPIIALRSTVEKKANIIIRIDSVNSLHCPKDYIPIALDSPYFAKQLNKELFVKPLEEDLEKYKTLNTSQSVTRDNFNQTMYSNTTSTRFYKSGNTKTNPVLTMDWINKILNKPIYRSTARNDYQLNLKTFTEPEPDVVIRRDVTTSLYKLEINCFILTIRIFILELIKYWIVYQPKDSKGNPVQCLKYLKNQPGYDDENVDYEDIKDPEILYSTISTFIKLCINFPLDIFNALPLNIDNDPNEVFKLPNVCKKYKNIYSTSYYDTIFSTNDKKIPTNSLYSRMIEALITYDLSINNEEKDEIAKLLLRFIRTESTLSSEFINKDNSLVLERRFPFNKREEHISYNESYAVKYCSIQLFQILSDELLNHYKDNLEFINVIFKSWIITLQSPSCPLKSYGASMLSSILNHVSYLFQSNKLKEKEKTNWIKLIEDIPHLRLVSYMNKEIYRTFSNLPMHGRDIQNLYSLVASIQSAERFLLHKGGEIIHNSNWKDGFDLGVVSDEYLVQLTGFSSDANVNINDPVYRDIKQGDYVIRGPNWKKFYYNQDGGEGSVGIVKSLTEIAPSSEAKSYQVEVEWKTAPGLPMFYFWNKNGEYEVRIVEYDSESRKIIKKLPLDGKKKENENLPTGVRLTINNNLRNEEECKFDGVIEYPQYCGKIKIEGYLGKLEKDERKITFKETEFIAGRSSSGWNKRYGTNYWIAVEDYNGTIYIKDNRIEAYIKYTIKMNDSKTVYKLTLSSDYLFQFMKEMISTKQVIVSENNDSISNNDIQDAYIYGSCGFVHGVKYFELKISKSSDDPRIGIGITSEIPIVGEKINKPYPQFIYFSNSQLSIMRERETLNIQGAVGIGINNYNQQNNNNNIVLHYNEQPQQQQQQQQPLQQNDNNVSRVNRNRVLPYGGLYHEGDVVGVEVNSSSDKLSFIYDGKKYGIPQTYEFPTATKDITVGHSYSSEWTIYPLIILPSQAFNEVKPEVKIHKWLSVEEYPSETLLFYGEVFNYLSPYFITDNDKQPISIPDEVIPFAFRYCKRWLSNKYRRYETRSKGVYVDLNIEGKGSFKAGTIAEMDNRDIEILGSYRGKIWYRLLSADHQDGYSRITRSVWYLNDDELQSIRIKEVNTSNYFDSTPFRIGEKEISELDFREAINSIENTKEFYMKVIKMINKICENKRVIPSNVIYKYVEEYYKTMNNTNTINNKEIIRYFSVISVLMMLNIIIERVLSYTEIDQVLSYNDKTFGNKNDNDYDNDKWSHYSQTFYIHQMKNYMFTLTKQHYLNEIVNVTETTIYYLVDDYAESNMIYRIKINRFTNVEFVPSIFQQLVKFFNDRKEELSDEIFRINYQGTKQGGQYRMFRVDLEDEGCVDSGGVYRAIFEQMIDELEKEAIELSSIFLTEDKSTPLLIKNDDKYMINFMNDTVDFYENIYYLGIFIASAYRCKMELNIPFIPMIWKCLVGKEIDKEEMEEILKKYIFFKEQSEDDYNEIESDKEEEKKRVINNTYKNIESAINQLCRGFYICIPQETVSILNEKELEQMICGIGKLNLIDLRNHTTYEEYNENDKIIKDFWNVLSEFNDTEINNFMNFAWAKTRISSNGIDFDFVIRRRYVSAEENPDDYLPTSHTCFYSLDLPYYTTKEIMKNKLKYAIFEALTLDGDFAQPTAEIYENMT